MEGRRAVPAILDSITDLIGDTPLVRLSRLAPRGNLLLKMELKWLGIVAAHVSLSDEAGLVCAYVVLESA